MTLSGTVARRRMVLVGVVEKFGTLVDLAADTDGVDASAVSAAEKENDFASLLSTAPADSGGVAVIVLGNRKSCKLAIAGEMGCAVRGVSGNNVEAYGVWVPC